MKLIALVSFFLLYFSSSYANESLCSWIMDEPFKEYQEEAKDKHSAMFVVVSGDECEYGIAIGEKSEEKAERKLLKIVRNGEKKIILQVSVSPLLLTTKFYGKIFPLLQMMKEKVNMTTQPIWLNMNIEHQIGMDRKK